jgi:hypothetical protein
MKDRTSLSVLDDDDFELFRTSQEGLVKRVFRVRKERTESLAHSRPRRLSLECAEFASVF